MPSFLPADTTLDAARVQFEVLRRMGPERRAGMIAEMSDNLRAVAEAGVRGRHPEYPERDVQLAVSKLMLGAELFAKVHPGAAVEP